MPGSSDRFNGLMFETDLSTDRIAYGQMISSGISWQLSFIIGGLAGSATSIPSFLIMLKRYNPFKSSPPIPTTSCIANDVHSSKKVVSHSPASIAQEHGSTWKIILALVRKRRFIAMTTAYSLVGFVREIVISWTSVIFVQVFQSSESDAATISILIPICMIVAATINGRTVDRLRGDNCVWYLLIIPVCLCLLRPYYRIDNNLSRRS